MEEIGRMKQMQLKPFAFILKKKKKIYISLFQDETFLSPLMEK